jgi:hypothetical protein
MIGKEAHEIAKAIVEERMKDFKPAYRQAMAREVEKKFDGLDCRFWACDDPAYLTHTDPIEAIEDIVDSHLSPNCDVAKEIEEMGSIQVEGYDPMTVTDKDISHASARVLDTLQEYFSEEFGDPEGDGDDLPKAECLPKITKLVRELFESRHVWRCEIVHTVELSAEEVITLMKHYRKDWFE